MTSLVPDFGPLLIAIVKAGVTMLGVACIYGAVNLWKQLGVSVASNNYGHRITLGSKEINLLRSEKSIRSYEKRERAEAQRSKRMGQLKNSFDRDYLSGKYDSHLDNNYHQERLGRAYASNPQRSKADRISEDMSL